MNHERDVVIRYLHRSKEVPSRQIGTHLKRVALNSWGQIRIGRGCGGMVRCDGEGTRNVDSIELGSEAAPVYRVMQPDVEGNGVIHGAVVDRMLDLDRIFTGRENKH